MTCSTAVKRGWWSNPLRETETIGGAEPEKVPPRLFFLSSAAAVSRAAVCRTMVEPGCGVERVAPAGQVVGGTVSPDPIASGVGHAGRDVGVCGLAKKRCCAAFETDNGNSRGCNRGGVRGRMGRADVWSTGKRCAGLAARGLAGPIERCGMKKRCRIVRQRVGAGSSGGSGRQARCCISISLA